LLEKIVVVLSNSKNNCFNVCEGIKALMFPLQWISIYVPILPMEMYDCLETIFPTIFGVLNTTITFEQVVKLLPQATIVDVDTQRTNSGFLEPFCLRYENQLQNLQIRADADLEIMPIRQAFLQVFIDAFSCLDSCITFNGARTRYEVNCEDFLDLLPECSCHHRCKNFWRLVLKSMSFNKYVEDKYDKVSYAKIFDRMTRTPQMKSSRVLPAHAVPIMPILSESKRVEPGVDLDAIEEEGKINEFSPFFSYIPRMPSQEAKPQFSYNSLPLESDNP
jgi:hypothetical protein